MAVKNMSLTQLKENKKDIENWRRIFVISLIVSLIQLPLYLFLGLKKEFFIFNLIPGNIIAMLNSALLILLLISEWQIAKQEKIEYYTKMQEEIAKLPN